MSHARFVFLRRLFFVVLTTGGASCISLIGGVGIEAVQNKLLPLVPLLIALPALNTMVGDYAAIIAAHATDPAERKHTKRELAHAIAKAIWVNIVGVLLLSIVIAWQRDYLFTGIFMTKFILFVVIAMLGVVAGMFGLTALLDKVLENHKLNPDDILIPIVTTITDVFMLGLIALAAVFLF
jgi:cation transporter-like permease